MPPSPPPPWDLAKRLLLEALAQPEAQRRAFLEQSCGRDGALVRDLLSLLAHHEAVERSGFLEVGRPPSEIEETADPGAVSSHIAAGLDGTHPNTVPPVASAASEPIPGLGNDRYEVLEWIGGGAMGLVYRGRHCRLGMEVAIKLLKAGASAERFLREARALAQIKSPHVVRIHDFEVLPSGQHILVMEWIDGRDIRQMMSDLGGRIDEQDVLPWMRHVCAGMQSAASAGIIHRDLKPSNILVDGRNQARVADFGLVRNPVLAGELSLTGQVMGTPYYMAPEQAEDPSSVDTRADIYSFGATFYHVLTGAPPFAGQTTFSILFKHKTEPLISPRARFPALSERTSQILERCLAKSPQDRFQSFGAILRQFESSSIEVSPWNANDEVDFAETLSRYRARRSAYLQSPRLAGSSDVYEFPDGRSIRIVVGDLVEQQVDAIVSSDDWWLPMDSGVAAAIRRAAGEQVASEAKCLSPVRPGRAVVTSGGGLRARFVFHGVTMGPEASRQPGPEPTAEVLVNPLHPDEKALVQSFEFPRFLVPSSDVISEVLASCIYHADTLNVTSIAFPLLGTGSGGFPHDVCLDTIFRFLCRTFGRGMTCVREARIVLFPDGD